MSTSLAQQLERLAVPQTSLLKRDKKRPSLLFDPKEAATLRRETVYQIGLDGLEELIAKNSVFEQFRDHLFDISSKGFERAVHTEEVNKKLDKLIRKFFLRLSPYFLLSCSHKALEWLVNRFLIHEYNRDDLLMLVLPYHESNIFVRVIQLMKFKNSGDPFLFLKGLQKYGTHLTKQGLLTHAANDVYFLKFVAKFIQSMIKEHDKPSLLTVPFNFYCTVFSGAIEFSGQVTENQISQMLPVLLKGLNSDISDYCAASYVILSRLLVKVTLSDVILDKFVEKISEAKIDNLRNEVVLVLLVLYQTQTHYKTIPENACHFLVSKPWILKSLEAMQADENYMTPFLVPLCKSFLNGALKEDEPSFREFIILLLDALRFQADFLGIFIGILLDAAKSKRPYEEEHRNFLTQTIETLERQYPEQFDKEIYTILSSTDEGKMNKRKKTLQRILQETMTHRGKFDVFDKLYHPSPQYRAEAIKYLAQNLSKLRAGEKEMIKSSFFDRLNDDSAIVVNETLDLVQTTEILDWETLKTSLIRLVNKCASLDSDWLEIAGKSIEMLCEKGASDDWNIFLAIFPYLLPSKKAQLQIANQIVKTKFIQSNKLIRMQIVDLKEADQFCNVVFDSLTNTSLEVVEDFVRVLKETPIEERTVLHKYFATLILSCILPDNSPISVNVHVIEIFNKYFDSSLVQYEKSNALYQHHINMAKKGKFAYEAYLLCVKKVVSKTVKPQNMNFARFDFSENDDLSRFFVLLAKSLFTNVQNSKKYVKFFLNYFCDDSETKIEFLLNIIVCENNTLTDQFRFNCLNFLIKLFESNETEFSSKLIIPYILSLLCNKNKDIRIQAFEIVEIYSKTSKDQLLNEILQQKEEILLDEEQTPLVLFTLLSSSKKEVDKLLNCAIEAETPIYLKANLLQALSQLNTIDIFQKTASLALDILNKQTEVCSRVESTIVYLNLIRFEALVSKSFKVNTNIWNLMEKTLKSDTLKLSFPTYDEFASILLLKQIDVEFYKSLSTELKGNLLDLIIKTVTLTTNSEIQSYVNTIIKRIELDSKLLLPQLLAMRDVISPKIDPIKLKRRKSFVPTVDILDTIEWRKGVTTLEILPDKKNLINSNELIPILFDVLKKCLDFDEQLAVEYPKQLILTSILHCCHLRDKKQNLEKSFNIELIVQCIRASQNPQTHHHALLVLAESAHLVPNQVLHHVMAIFTFMGSSVLRHDDVYSIQIIVKIMDTIIPILLADGDEQTIAKVLRVFVDAIMDVPEHRRMPLYKQLLDKVGVDANLHVFLILVLDSHVTSGRIKEKNDSFRKLDIAGALTREYQPEIVIYSCIQLVKLLKELPNEVTTENYSIAYDIVFKTPKQFRHFKYSLITFIASLLSGDEFVTKVAELSNEVVVSLEGVFKDLVIEILTYIQRVSKISDKSVNTPQAQYWKIVLHHSYDILDSVNALLNPQMFFLVIKGLMLHKLPTVRRRALELLNTKLQYSDQFFADVDNEEIYTLVPALVLIIKTINDEDGQDQEVIVQTALLSLKLLVKVLSSEYTTKFTEILDFITELIKCNVSNNVLASLVLCLAELCVSLRANAISGLPIYFPALIKILKQQKRVEDSNLLLMSTVTALQKIVDTLPLFLSPYLEKLLVELCQLSSKWDDGDKKQPIVTKLANLRTKIGTVVPARILVPAIGHVYQVLVDKSAFNSIGALMAVLGENFSMLKGPEINPILPELSQFFLSAFQFRADSLASFEECAQIERYVFGAFTKLMLKLSESSFKPLFYKLFDWAVRTEVKNERLITFYGLTNEMADCLKGIFVLFVVHLLSNVGSTLDSCNKQKSESLYFEDEDKTLLLLENILKTLMCACGHASHRFITKDRFEVLMQPLVDQLDNDLGGIEALQRRNVEILTPAIVNFVVATPDDFLWKQINYQILLKMRSTLPEVRLIALHCLTEIVKKLGEDFLPLIPETIPFLAELLEDEEEHVEKQCKKAVQEMEKVLGESLQKYF